MFRLMTTAAIAALLAASPAVSQTAGTGTDQAAAAEEVYRNDLPETHAGFGLPELSTGSGAITGDGAQTGALDTVASGAVAAQQFGNVAASKHASGVIRDLGDVMILLHGEINDRLDSLGEDAELTAGLPQTMSEVDQQALDMLRDLNDREFNAGFAAWVAESYPYMIAAWRQLEGSERFADLAGAVVPHLESQLAVAEQVVTAEGDLQQVDGELAATLASGRGVSAGGNGGPTGAEGQTGERQHTPEPEAAEVQTGENYRHEQVETDEHVRTQAMPEGGDGQVIPAGESDIINAAGLFSALENPKVELEQLRGVSGLGADRVRIVSSAELIDPAEAGAVERTVAEREAAIDELRAALEANEAISGAIERAGASLDEVIALDVIDEGAVLYTWTR